MKKKRPTRRPQVEGFRAPTFPLRSGKEIADALGVTRRRLEQMVAAGEEKIQEGAKHPESIGYLTRSLLPKGANGRYLPVSRKQYDYILGSVLSINERMAQKRNAGGRLTGELDFAKDLPHWVGTVYLVPTGEPGTYRIGEGCVQDLPNLRVLDVPPKLDAYGDPVID